MPLEIKELIIRVIVNEEETGSSMENVVDQELIIQESVEQVMDILNDKNER